MRYFLVCYLILFTAYAIGDVEKPEFNVNKGSGSYEIQLNSIDPNENIEIHYYMPSGFSEDTSVIIVIPGAGRNANDYRDSWVQSAEKYNLLVLSPLYPEENYDFAAYHLGGVVNELNLKNPTIERLNGRISKYRMNDEDIEFSFAKNKSDWMFDDFDKIFSSLRSIIGSKQISYDLFGHSAGGQILHRYAIFKQSSKANRIVAANSGFYTLPDVSVRYPFGTGGTPVSQSDINKSFTSKLVVLLGESDNKSEKRGTMLHTPKADTQGLGRFERGKYFYSQSQELANSAKTPFNWQLKLVKGVGHDYRKMGVAAAELLYGKK